MKRDCFFWAACVIALLAAGGVAFVYLQSAPLVEERLTQLNAFQERQLDLFQGRVGILLTLATIVIGGVGALLLYFHEGRSGSVFQQRCAVLAMLTASLSAFCGYFAYEAVIWMLENRFFNLQSDAVQLMSDGQLWMSVASIVCLVLCFLATPERGEIK